MFRLTVETNPYLAKQSLSPPQFRFLTWPAREILYGGAAGGGKSFALLAAALQYVTVPGYAALLLRRSFSDLNQPKALIPLSHELLCETDARWDGQKYRWTFPNGATLSFGYLDSEIDKYRYQGAAYQFIGYDELTQFTETQYLYLHSRLRKLEGMPVPLRVRAATNPGGTGHAWVRNRFIDERSKREGCVFIPAKLEDNPWLDQQAYETSLAELDRVTRQQLRHGDWDIRPDGNLFIIDDFRTYDMEGGGEFYRLSREPGNSWVVPVADCQRFATVDVAATEKTSSDYSVVGVWDITPSHDIVLADLRRWKAQIPQVVDKTIDFARDTDCEFVAVEMNGVGIAVLQSLRLRGLAVRALKAKTDKLQRSVQAQLFVEAHKVHLPRKAKWLRDFLDEVQDFPTGANDDQVDVLSWAALVMHQMGLGIRKAADEQHAAKREAEAIAESSDPSPGKKIAPESIDPSDDDDPEIRAWLEGQE